MATYRCKKILLLLLSPLQLFAGELEALKELLHRRVPRLDKQSVFEKTTGNIFQLFKSAIAESATAPGFFQ